MPTIVNSNILLLLLVIIIIIIIIIYTSKVVRFCVFVNALYEWNVTKTNSCLHLNVTGE